jgi:hypothetical protein
MTIDKETLIKHHFWILSGCVLPLALFALIWLPTMVSGDNDEDMAKIEKAEKAMANPGDIKNKKFLDALEEEDGQLGVQKAKIWADVWQAQKGLFTLPKELQKVDIDKVAFGSSIFDLGGTELLSLFARKEVYADYVTNIYEKEVPIAPTWYGDHEEGTWKDILRWVPSWKDPDDEEIWLSMEDTWVQRELLRAIKQTNEGVAWFTPTDQGPAAQPSAEAPRKRSFRNPYWQLDLDLPLDGKVLKGKLTNISKRRQQPNVTFWVQVLPKEDLKVPFAINLTDPKLLPAERQRLPFATDRERQLFVEVRVSGDTLAVGESLTLPEVPCKIGTGLFSVLQQLKLETAPVKCLKGIRLGEMSERTSLLGKQLKSRAEEPAPAPAKGMSAPAGGIGGSADAKAAAADEAKKLMGSGDKADSSSGSGSSTKNGLERKRYVEVTTQVRRMPVAIRVLADQDHMQDLLRALANSKLRMQTTQVYWNHTNSPQAAAPGKASDGPARPGAPAAIGGSGAKESKAQGADDQESNVVQLVFYGIISLYERPRPEPK